MNGHLLWRVVVAWCVAFWPALLFGQATSWEQDDKAGWDALKAGRLDEAGKRFLAAVGQAQRFQDIRLAISQSGLARVCQAQGKHAAAEYLYESSLEISEKAIGKDDPGVAADLDRLGEVYQALRRYTKAESAYKRSLDIREKQKASRGDPTLAIGPDLRAYAAIRFCRSTITRSESELPSRR